jgi:hypothetical protein
VPGRFFEVVGVKAGEGRDEVPRGVVVEDRGAAFARRGDQEAHRRITEERRRSTAKINMVTRRVTVEQPVRRIEHVIDGYRTRVVDTVTEVTEMTERVIGHRALQGGVPVIELLLTLGLGIERYCTMTGDRPSAAAVACDRMRRPQTRWPLTGSWRLRG